MEALRGTVAGWMAQGGLVMWILLGFSVVAVAVIVERFISLRRAGFAEQLVTSVKLRVAVGLARLCKWHDACELVAGAFDERRFVVNSRDVDREGLIGRCVITTVGHAAIVHDVQRDHG